MTGRDAEGLLREALGQFADDAVIAYEDALEGKHNDFRLLMEEYHDGILLFELTDRKVWSRAVRDTRDSRSTGPNTGRLRLEDPRRWPHFPLCGRRRSRAHPRRGPSRR